MFLEARADELGSAMRIGYLPAWMNERVNEMPLDWDLLRKQSGEWLRYWDTEIRGKSRK